MKLPFPTLDYANIAARYPKAVKKIEEWLFTNTELKEQLATQVEATKYPEEELKTHFTGTLIQMDPRKLYDIFDAMGICIGIGYSPLEKKWSYSNNESDIYLTDSRHNAEVSAFHDAFEVLENQL